MKFYLRKYNDEEKSLEESDEFHELDFLKKWADRSIVYPPDFGTQQKVDKAYDLIKCRLNELIRYKKEKK